MHASNAKQEINLTWPNTQIKEENVTVFFKNLQNVMLASISYHIIPTDLVIIMLV